MSKTIHEKSEEKLSKLMPDFADRVRKLIALAESDGFTLQVTQGLRTAEEQNALYAQGRTRKGAKVTNAKAWQSFHNYGIAADVAFLVNGAISWDEKLYQHIGKWADAAGVEWGGRWKKPDLPHVQLTAGLKIADAFRLYNKGWLPNVWATIKARLEKETK